MVTGGGLVATLLVAAGLVSLVWTPYALDVLDPTAAWRSPMAGHWLGTDGLGRDVFSRLTRGLLSSAVAGLVATTMGVIVGVPLGLAAAAWRVTASWPVAGLSAFVGLPAIFTLVLLSLLTAPGLATAILALGIASIAPMIATARDGVRTIKGPVYFDAARLAGLSGIETFRRHVAPALARLVLAQGLRQGAAVILAEAAFGFLGLGAQPATISLGVMLREAMAAGGQSPAALLAPGIALLLLAGALLVAGAGLQQQTEPRLRSVGGFRGLA